jgi:hypothetical protein
MLLARSNIGRTTIHVLALNHPQQLSARRALLDEGVFDLD